MKRRSFVKTAGGLFALGPAASLVTGGKSYAEAGGVKSMPDIQSSSVRVSGDQVLVETSSLSAEIRNGFLISLVSKTSGENFLQSFDTARYSALDIIYPNTEVVEFSDSNFRNLVHRQISGQRAEIIFHSWHGDGVITISTDDVMGDLIIEPSVFSSRPGVMACRWNMPGIRHDLKLVAPFFQGAKLSLDDPLIRDFRWPWPMYWEAALAILQSVKGGFYIHAQDTRYTYKALKTGSAADPFMLGFDTEAYGPVDDNLASGGLSWRINVFEGDWKVPAARYRDWLWKAYGLEKEETRRAPWFSDVSFAISWCPGDPELPEVLAKKISPSKVLIHYPDWRTDIYDQNYPDYTASEAGKTFIRKCMEKGFHIMPHFNAIDMDPSHPVYTQIRDFQYRSIEKKQVQGWSWVDGRVLGVPESNETRMHNRQNNVMIKVHPGLSMWRTILGENIRKAVNVSGLDSVFIDVTLVTQNLHNCLVESMTSTEGMKRLIQHVGMLEGGLVVGGEGLNEITMQGQSFAQAHLFKSWQRSVEGLERTGGCDLNQFLFGKLCRIFGYSGMSGKDEDSELRMQMHIEHGGIPTITINSVKELIDPNPAVKRMLEMANSM
jgi:hypothetical protein